MTAIKFLNPLRDENGNLHPDLEEVAGYLSAIDYTVIKLPEWLNSLYEIKKPSPAQIWVRDQMLHSKTLFETVTATSLEGKLDKPEILVDHYDWDGKPIELWEWMVKRTFFPIHVALDTLEKWVISTVWVGIGFPASHEKKPLIFETFVGTIKNPSEIAERYSSLLEAKMGHYRHVHECKTV